MEEKVKSREEKAANILFTLNRLVLVERHGNPIYESLIEKVERLLEMWKEKTKDYERIYREGARIIDEINALSERQKVLGFSKLEYSMLLTLEDKLGSGGVLVENIKKLSTNLKELMFPGWFNQTTIRKEIEREVRRFTRGLKKEHNLTLDEMNNLYEKLLENIKNYGAT